MVRSTATGREYHRSREDGNRSPHLRCAGQRAPARPALRPRPAERADRHRSRHNRPRHPTLDYVQVYRRTRGEGNSDPPRGRDPDHDRRRADPSQVWAPHTATSARHQYWSTRLLDKSILKISRRSSTTMGSPRSGRPSLRASRHGRRVRPIDRCTQPGGPPRRRMTVITALPDVIEDALAYDPDLESAEYTYGRTSGG